MNFRLDLHGCCPLASSVSQSAACYVLLMLCCLLFDNKNSRGNSTTMAFHGGMPPECCTVKLPSVRSTNLKDPLVNTQILSLSIETASRDRKKDLFVLKDADASADA